MKKLISMIALVAMVAMSSVAYAETNTLQITGTVNTSNVAITSCTGAITPTITPLAEGNATCDGTFTSNDLDGFTIDMQGDTATMATTSGAAGTIAAFNWVATSDETCDIGEDCFAVMFDGPAFEATIDDTPTYTTDPGTNTNSYETGDHAVPTGGQQVLATSVDTSVTAGVYELEYTANVDNNVTANDTYQHDGDVYITAL